MDGRRLLLGKGSRPPATCGGSSPWMPSPGLRERWLATASRAWEGMAQAPCWRRSPSGAGDHGRPVGTLSRQRPDLTSSPSRVSISPWWRCSAGGSVRLFGLRRGPSAYRSCSRPPTAGWRGLQVATERALIMVLVWSLLRWLKRDWPSHRIWLWAFVVLILWDPFALYSAGSGSPSWRWPCCCWRACCTRVPAWCGCNSLLLLGLLPCSCCCSRGWRPGALLNLLALPLFCLGIIPLALIGVLVAPDPHAPGPMACSGCPIWGLEWVLRGLGWLATTCSSGGLSRLADARQRPADPAVGAWHLPGGRAFCSLWWRPCCWPVWSRPPWRQVRVLDVGAGAIGARHPGSEPSCSIPGIATPGATTWRMRPSCPAQPLGVRVLDTLIISHRGQGSPAGNRQAVLQNMPVRRELSSFPFAPAPGLSSWPAVALAGLDLRVLWPRGRGGAQQRQLRPAVGDGRHRLPAQR